jgi:dihydroorotate dehydrogenase (NAD+) catalytic subunit
VNRFRRQKSTAGGALAPAKRKTGKGRIRTPVDLTARIGDVILPNPVMTASGTAGHGTELAAYLDLSRLGAVVVKSLSPEPWAGNPPPRVYPANTAGAGMLNSVGLDNPGIDQWLERDLPALTDARARVVVSVWGFTVDDYQRVTKAIKAAVDDGRGHAIVAVEANISCPNIEDRNHMFAHSCDATKDAIRACVAGLSGTRPPLPVWAKLSPNVTDITEIAGAALDGGAAGLTLINTLMGLALDPATGRPRLGNGGGGLSGPALHPVAVRAVFDCRAAFSSTPIVGAGGVTKGEDAAEFFAAGADAVQVGTATFADPRAPARVLAEFTTWCRTHRIERLSDLKGIAHDH